MADDEQQMKPSASGYGGDDEHGYGYGPPKHSGYGGEHGYGGYGPPKHSGYGEPPKHSGYGGYGKPNPPAVSVVRIFSIIYLLFSPT